MPVRLTRLRNWITSVIYLARCEAGRERVSVETVIGRWV